MEITVGKYYHIVPEVSTVASQPEVSTAAPAKEKTPYGVFRL